MTDNEAYKLIGERAEELTSNTEVQKKMVEIAKTEGKEKAEKFLYNLAIATLCGAQQIKLLIYLKNWVDKTKHRCYNKDS